MDTNVRRQRRFANGRSQIASVLIDSGRLCALLGAPGSSRALLHAPVRSRTLFDIPKRSFTSLNVLCAFICAPNPSWMLLNCFVRSLLLPISAPSNFFVFSWTLPCAPKRSFAFDSLLSKQHAFVERLLPKASVRQPQTQNLSFLNINELASNVIVSACETKKEP